MAGVETVYVVDDDRAVRDSLAQLLRRAGLKARTFASPLDFLADYRPRSADCLVLEVRLPKMSGLEVQERLIARGARIPVIFLSGHGDIPTAVEAVRNGALDFLVKPFDEEALLHRVREAFGSTPGGARHAGSGAHLRAMARLSQREREVLGGILGGKTNRVVAADLAVTVKTVEYHRARIMRKLRVKSAAELFQLCLHP